MPIYKATAWFELRGRGWSETWYRDSGGESDLTVLLNFDVAMWNKRALCLGTEAQIIARSTSLKDVNNDSRESFAAIPGNPGFHCASPAVALNVLFYSALAAHRKFVFLRGIDDNAEMNGGQFTPGSALAFQDALSQWRNIVIQNSYGWLGIGAPLVFDLNDYTQNVDETVTIHCAPLTFPVGQLGTKQRVIITNANGSAKSKLNGKQVVVVDKTDQSLCTSFKPIALFTRTATVPGKIKRFTPTLYVAVDAAVQKVGERKTGKVFAVPVGRVPAKARG